MLLQQLVIYATIGTIMDYAGFNWTTTLYWCTLILVAVSNYIARKEGYEEATELAQTVWQASRRALEAAEELNNNNNPDKNK